MSNFTALELSVLDAIADGSTEIAPELSGQIADARVASRTNDGAAVFAVIQVDRSAAAPIRSASARLAPVHADVAGLVDPLRFEAIVADGFLVGLQATAYGEDIGAVDFDTAAALRLYRTAPEGDLVEIPPRVPVELAIHRLQREEEWERNPFAVPTYPLPPGRTPRFRPSLTRALARRLRASPAGVQALEWLGRPAPRAVGVVLAAAELALFGLIMLVATGLDGQVPGLRATFARLGMENPIDLVFPLLILVVLLGLPLRLRQEEVRRRRTLQRYEGG